MTRTTINVGLLGYGFMGQAHTFAYRALTSLATAPPLTPCLHAVCGRDGMSLERTRQRYGWEHAVTDWRTLVADPDIELFDNSAPNALHREPTVAAARAGKHLVCEKPLATSSEDAYALWVEAENAGVVHMCGFNYRFIPAVRLAREILEAGDLGDTTHFRGRFLASSALDPRQTMTWRFRRADAGTGALGDLGSHLIDLARYLVGDPTAVSAVMKTFITERDGELVDVDDAVEAVLQFNGGAIGTLEASRVAGRRANTCAFEVDGTKGSLSFTVERLNELEVGTDRKRTLRIDVTDPEHPFMSGWWPSPGHTLGWGDSFTHEMGHLLHAIGTERSVAPHGADFRDGYYCAEVCAAIARSAAIGQRQSIAYRPPPRTPTRR